MELSLLASLFVVLSMLVCHQGVEPQLEDQAGETIPPPQEIRRTGRNSKILRWKDGLKSR